MPKEKSKTNITVYDGNNCDYVDWRTEIVAASMYNNTFDAHENDNLPTAVVLVMDGSNQDVFDAYKAELVSYEAKRRTLIGMIFAATAPNSEPRRIVGAFMVLHKAAGMDASILFAELDHKCAGKSSMAAKLVTLRDVLRLRQNADTLDMYCGAMHKLHDRLRSYEVPEEFSRDLKNLLFLKLHFVH